MCIKKRKTKTHPLSEREVRMTEKQLKQAFEYQKFERNPRLQAVIDAVHERVTLKELSDEDLDWVAAAGSAEDGKPAGIRKPQKPEDDL